MQSTGLIALAMCNFRALRTSGNTAQGWQRRFFCQQLTSFGVKTRGNQSSKIVL